MRALTLPSAMLPPDHAIPDEAYRRALAYLYAFSPPDGPPRDPSDRLRKVPRTRALLARLGDPHERFQSILVAGTKGKGSTATMLDSVVRAAGYRTGLYTQPHLHSWRERTRVDGEPIGTDDVVALTDEIRPAVAALERDHPELGSPTTFEVGTAVTFLAFARAGVSLAVVEVGVGGIHDATNVVAPLLVVLGPISLDHTATLGGSLAAIAAEKAGLFCPGGLAVVGHQPPEALAVVERLAEERGTRLERLGREWRWGPEDDRPASGSFSIFGPAMRLTGLTVPLLGRHQRDNAALAVASAHALSAHGFSIGADAIRRGLATVDWPGRLQVLRERPWLVVDGAHNGDSAHRLADALRECFGPRPVHLVLGLTEGKEVGAILDALLPLAERLTVTRSSHQRAYPVDALAADARARGAIPRVVADPTDAVRQALTDAEPDDLVCVTGSLFLVGEILGVGRWELGVGEGASGAPRSGKVDT